MNSPPYDSVNFSRGFTKGLVGKRTKDYKIHNIFRDYSNASTTETDEKRRSAGRKETLRTLVIPISSFKSRVGRTGINRSDVAGESKRTLLVANCSK